MKVLVSPPVFAVGRLLVGISTWSAPSPVSKSFGLDIKAPAGAYWARLFAVRDAVLGVGLILSEGEDRRRWRILGIACDTIDAAAGEIAARESNAKGATRWALPGVAAAVAVLGVVGLLTDE
jgi:hypothetical protein